MPARARTATTSSSSCTATATRRRRTSPSPTRRSGASWARWRGCSAPAPRSPTRSSPSGGRTSCSRLPTGPAARRSGRGHGGGERGARAGISGPGAAGTGRSTRRGLFTVERDWTDGAMPSLAGTLRLADFGPEIVAELPRGAHGRARRLAVDRAHARGPGRLRRCRRRPGGHRGAAGQGRPVRRRLLRAPDRASPLDPRGRVAVARGRRAHLGGGRACPRRGGGPRQRGAVPHRHAVVPRWSGARRRTGRSPTPTSSGSATAGWSRR